MPLYARLTTAEQQKGVCRAQRTANRHRHERGRIESHGAGHTVCDRYRHGPDQPLLGPTRCSGCRSSPCRKRRPINGEGDAAGWRRAFASGCIAKRTFLARDRYTAPEIQRSNLAAVILQAKAAGAGRDRGLSVSRSAAARGHSRRLCHAVRAGSHRRRAATDRVGADAGPAAGRSAHRAADSGRGRRELFARGVDHRGRARGSDPRERPLERQQAADEAHEQFADEQSDFLSYLKLWDFFHDGRRSVAKSVPPGVPRQFSVVQPDAGMARRPPAVGPALTAQAGLRPHARRRFDAIHRAC